MGMGPPFDPLSRSIRELKQRAKLLLRTNGEVLINSDGTKSGSAESGRVKAYISGTGLRVRYLIDEPVHHLLRWKLAYGEDSFGYESSRDPRLIHLCLEHLRRFQVLDDMAGT